MLAVLLAVLWWPGGGTPTRATHPMHTSVAEIGYDQASHLVSVSIRVFGDDFGAALATRGTTAPPDSAMAAYLRETFNLVDRSGRPLLLHWDGAERAGDVIRLRLRATAPAGLSGAKVLSALLCERFENQVNIVRAAYDGRAITLLFTRGDTSKSLP